MEFTKEDDEVMVEDGMIMKALVKLIFKMDRLLRSIRADPIKLFSESGPKHIISFNWNDLNHRTAVLSSLVTGVYILEKRRQQNLKTGLSDLDPEDKLWWEFFNFTITEKLVDPDGSIYGAVFAYKDYRNTPHSKSPPCHVIAFRGTVLKRRSWLRDLKLDLRCFFGSLEKSSRFNHAFKVIERVIEKTGNIADVWLTGHSLGAAMVLLAGNIMTRSRSAPESYLFNPPFLSIPIEKLVNNEMLKNGFRFAGSLLKAGVAKTVEDKQHLKGEEDASNMRLASWRPYLYLNSSDWFCSEYIGYFKHRAIMTTLGAGKIERIATRNSLMSILIKIYHAVEGEGSSSQHSSSEPLHVLPSAYLKINTHKSQDCVSGHEIHQWWDPECTGEFVLHQFNE